MFIDAGIYTQDDDAVCQLSNVISEKRAKLHSGNLNQDELHSLTINMLPLPIMVIQESKSVKDLITVALQLREEYQELRNWLGCYQQALSDGKTGVREQYSLILKAIGL